MSDQPVWGHLQGAKTMIEFADGQLLELAQLTGMLHRPDSARQVKPDVWRCYVSWLVFARQVGVSVNNAGEAAGNPPEFAAWWEGLKHDEVHRFFWKQRNIGLKDVGEVISQEVIEDPEFGPQAYWTFPDGPHEGDPLVARCKQYVDWLYESLWSPAAEHLFEFTASERRDNPDSALF